MNPLIEDRSRMNQDRKDDVTTHGAVRRRPLGTALSIAALVVAALGARLTPAHAQPSLTSDTGAIYFGDAPVESVLPDGTSATEYTALAGLVSGTVALSPDRTK